MSEPKISFAPLFDTVVNALKTDLLLACVGRTYASAANARLSRTQECENFFSLSSWRRSRGRPALRSTMLSSDWESTRPSAAACAVSQPIAVRERR